MRAKFFHGSVDHTVEVTKLWLWRRFDGNEGSSNEYWIEPDVVIDGLLNDEPFRWIIEVKWDALLYRDQIETQVRLCTGGFTKWMHFSIVKSAESDAFRSKFTKILQWNQVLRALSEISRQSTEENASVLWCQDAIAFLKKLGVGTFQGFQHLSLVSVPVETINFLPRPKFALRGLAKVAPIEFSLKLEKPRV